MKKDIFGVQVIVNANAINLATLLNISNCSNCKCRKKLFDKLVEECTENIDETKLVKKNFGWK